jgi:hypothetical protein
MKKMALILIFSFFCHILTAPPNELIYIEKTEPINVLLTWSNIDSYIAKIGIKEPEIVKAQIRHETGNLTSYFCLKQNNLFGMRFAPLRKTTAIKEDNHMAIYRSWQESIEDYALWQKRYYKGGDYFQFLSRIGYATDLWYLFKVRKLLKTEL